ncbi:MAG TPA: hypothetical protein VK589_29365 [Chryseolinea sp.]|nr:hypothetical protein [Chryseolinea sp.]
MKTSTPYGTAAIVTMVLSVILPIVANTVDLAITGYSSDNPPYSQWNDKVNSYCTGPDLVITSVGPYAEAAGGDKKFTVFIKNVGDAPAVMDYPKIAGWQAYLSANGVTKNILVNGKNFSGTLDVGQTISATSVVSASLVSKPHYLIVELYVLSSVGECNSSNNTFIFSPQQQ